MTNPTIDQLEFDFDSEMPTRPDLERAALAAQIAARALNQEEDPWCSSEAPTGVEAERPLFPRPPRTPRV